MASGILNPALAYLPRSKALHVRCRLLPEDLITSPNINRMVAELVLTSLIRTLNIAFFPRHYRVVSEGS
jgi:hypothetical protein